MTIENAKVYMSEVDTEIQKLRSEIAAVNFFLQKGGAEEVGARANAMRLLESSLETLGGLQERFDRSYESINQLQVTMSLLGKR